MKILKNILVLALLSQVAACVSKPTSAYESGWTENTNEDAYNSCGRYRWDNKFKEPAVLQHLITSGALTSSQAQRAESQDVRVGDPECLAYAAYGLNRAKIGFQRNKEGQVTEKIATYLCFNSEKTCSGVRVHFADGKVSRITPVSE
ncbi:uncharacterized protein YwbE [Pseudomonas brassicacearum]|uniref:Uncharacterized protein YwbE n=1 Tax=Pseudomonas brassicacearum TaxID=930166 RepID=A0AAW8M780_9PSED|nr:hypothetical protein [Pseudomonas brassicacearum]MDR6957439.1 uncharacterized protein YwbE [Pseudomonas brassicacearum]